MPLQTRQPFRYDNLMLKQELAHLAVFSNLDPAELERIAPLLNLRLFHPDEVIFEQGQVAVYLYILLDGEVVINYKPYDGPPLTVARITPGGVFGWSAALHREVYTSAAVSLTRSEAICLSSLQLKTLCEKYPRTGMVLLEHLADVIAQRLNSTHAQILSILTQGMTLGGD